MKPRWNTTKLTECKMKWLGNIYIVSVIKLEGQKYKCYCYINDRITKQIHDNDTLTEAKQAGMKWIREQCFFEEESK